MGDGKTMAASRDEPHCADLTPERWHRAKEVLHQAMQVPPLERDSFLDRACASDGWLRREVESLLAVQNEACSSFLEVPACKPLSSPASPLAPGIALGRYVIVNLVGAGGMGEVYRAQDTLLPRMVAIKVIPAHLASDPERRQRFECESRAISTLQHPHICTLYDIGSQDGTDYLVMECLAGETLASRLARRRLSLREVLRYAIEIADALETAHGHAIVHRDLKPSNIFLTSHGECKVLDFGLAKISNEVLAAATTAPQNAATAFPSGVGGTMAYMAPEQVRGEAADARTDLFSFGLVLHEMATGATAFFGSTPEAISKEILYTEPTGAARLDPSMPAELGRIISKALQKKRELRYQQASALHADLRQLKDQIELRSAADLGTGSNGLRVLRKNWKLLSSVTLALTAIMLGSAFFSHKLFPHKKPGLTDKDKIILADFENKTGDPIFDHTLRRALALQVEQSPFLNVLSDERVNETLQLMGHSPRDRVDETIARDLCQRVGSKAMLVGSIVSVGGQYQLGLMASDCSTGERLASEQMPVPAREQVLPALDKVTTHLRQKLGESLASIQKYDTTFQQATTGSLEALKAYSMGVLTKLQKGDTMAVPFYKAAIELDPNFAAAYADLAVSYTNLGEPSLAAKSIKKAYELQDRVSERERLRISAYYFGVNTGELQKEAEIYKQWIQSYPRDAVPHGDLGVNEMLRGQYENAVTEYRKALSLEPSSTNYGNLALVYTLLGRLDNARATIQEAGSHKFDDLGLHYDLYNLAFLADDSAEMARQVTWAAGRPGAEDPLLSTHSDTQAYYGRLKMARELSRRSVQSALRDNSPETAALWQVNAALREVEMGNVQDAKRNVAAALTLGPGRDVRLLAALVLARAGDRRKGNALLKELEEKNPSDTLLKFYWLPTIRAATDFSHGYPGKGIDRLALVVPYQLSDPPPFQLGTLYPVYLRGQMYLATHEGPKAAAEFRTLLNNRSIVLNFATGALARLGLARAYALQHDRAKAKSAYEDFLSFWKNADPDIPILKQAKSEYEKLR
jgi:serine/threonine protein kinase/tetratricopeptide (TPR) repeat protein